MSVDYFAAELARCDEHRATLEALADALRDAVEAFRGPGLPPVLPGAALTGPRRASVNVTDWHAGTEHGRGCLFARLEADVNGKHYRGDATITVFQHRDEISVWVSGRDGGFTDAARKTVVGLIEAHYLPLVTVTDIRRWGALVSLRRELEDKARELWSGTWWKVNDARRELVALVGSDATNVDGVS